MKLHLVYTSTITTEKALPSDYAPLYPEIPHISQPLGFHGMTALVTQASRTSIIPASTVVGIIMAALGCVSIYLLGKTLFSEEKGLAAAFSFSFLSFVSHQLGFSGSYIILAGITVQIAAVTFLVKASRKKTMSSYVMAALFCAACFSIDLNAFFPLLVFFTGFLIIHRSLFSVLPLFILFSVPQLSRITLPAPTPLEQHFILEWFQNNAILSLTDLWIVVFSVGPLLIMIALLQIASQRTADSLLHWKNQRIPLGLYTIPLFIPVLLGLHLPFWYIVDSVLIFRMVSIPLSVVAGLFLVTLKSIGQFKWFLSGLILFSAVIHVTDPFVILPVSSPTVDQDSLSAYTWIHENTLPEASFCTFTSSGDSSTWIPAAAARKVFLPFHLYYQKDNCMSRLTLPERFTDAAILKVMPGSAFAHDILRKYGFSHVYIDEKSGVNVDQVLSSPLYNLEFHQHDVYIFSVTDAEPPPCEPRVYRIGKQILYKTPSYFHLANPGKGNVLGIYYKDEGIGNVDVEVNGEYVGTIFRFDSGNHFLAVFSISPGECNVSFLPYDTLFTVDYLVIFACEY